MYLFQMGVTGGILIIFIAVVRVLAIHHLPKTTFLALWIIAALRLLLPFSIPLPFHINIDFNVFADVIQELPSGTIGFPLPGERMPSYAPGAAVSHPAAEPLSLLVILWLVGVLLMALYFTISYVRSMKKFRMSLPDNTPYIREWLTRHQIVRTIEVRSSDLILSPLTYGILRPVILLPKKFDRNDWEALQYVLTHEYIHIRRFDAFTKILFAAALCVHWMNPLVWVMYVLANRDMELSCDAGVIQRMGEKNRSSYALTLLKLEERKSRISALHNYFGKNAISERIEAIMKFKRTSAAAIAAALMLAAGATTAFAAYLSGWQEFDLDDLTRIEGNIGTKADGMEMIDTTGTEVQIMDIELDGEGNDTAYEVQVVGDSAVTFHAVIDMEDAESEDIADLSGVEIIDELPLISVSHDDEAKFSAEEWEKILMQIERGELYWED